MSFLADITDMEFYENSLAAWGGAVLIAGIVYIGLRFIRNRGLQGLKKLAARDRTGWMALLAEALDRTKWFVLLLLAVYAGLRGLTLPPVMESNLRIMAFAAFFIQIGLWTGGMLDGWTRRHRERQIKTNPGAVTTLGAVRLVLHGLIWVAVVLLILDNIGFDITALVAGLGIGGVAVALAVQNILGDLFASLSIVLDKTFVVGDFIIIGEYMGTVEHIGLKTTRIRSLSGEQIVFSNSDLLNGRIRNYGRMYERRVPVKIGVIYQTGRDKLKKIPAIIREAVEAQQDTRFDRAHFLAYGEFSLDFEYVYYVQSPDYNFYMDTQQNINFHIHEKFEEEGIEFAYPTRTLYIESSEAAGAQNRRAV